MLHCTCTALVWNQTLLNITAQKAGKKTEYNGIQRQKLYHIATFVLSAFKVLNYHFRCQMTEQLMS